MSYKPNAETMRWVEYVRTCREKNPGATMKTMAKALGITQSNLESTWLRYKNRPQTVTPQITSPAPVRDDPAKLWEESERRTDADVERSALERFVDIAIPDTAPIGISFISDQHIRLSGPTQMRRMREDAELVAVTPGLYGILGGDGIDNHIKHLTAMVSGGSKVSEEWRLYDHYLGMFGDKLLTIISGNHDDWTRDFAGVDMVSQLAQKRRVHYCPDEALIRLRLGEQPYAIKMRHQYRYNSSFNLLHAVKRLWEMGMDKFDVGVLGHHHDPAIEAFTKQGQRVWGARPGSYQLTSAFSRRHGFNHPTPTCPTFIFLPTEHRVMGFWDLREAASYLTWLRDGWPDSWAA